jgi:hypothetical protein
MASDEAPPTWGKLPDWMAALIFNEEPVDTRLRCAEVSKHWYQLPANALKWPKLDVSPDGCQTTQAASRVLLRGFAAFGKGRSREFLAFLVIQDAFVCHAQRFTSLPVV